MSVFFFSFSKKEKSFDEAIKAKTVYLRLVKVLRQNALTIASVTSASVFELKKTCQ